MEYKQWKEILSAINNEADLSKDNIIEKVKEKLEATDPSAYEEWEKTGFDVNYLFQVKHAQYALLHLVALNNLGNVAGALLKVEGINVNAEEKCGWTPLHFAAQYGNKEIVDVLLANGADVNAKGKNGWKYEWKGEWTPLHFAAKNNRKEIVDTLLANKADVNAKDKDGWTPLHLAAENGNKEIVDALLANKADVNAKDKDGNTPLHLAAKESNFKTIKVLLEKGADPLLKNKYGQTPRDLANDESIIQLLKDAQTKQILSKAVKTGVTLGIITALTVGIGCGTAGVELSILAIVGIAVASALVIGVIAGGIKYSVLKPSTKMDETKEAQNVNGAGSIFFDEIIWKTGSRLE